MRSARLTYAVILAGAIAWCTLIVIAPAAASSAAYAPLATFLYAFFSPLCHQIDARSLHLFGGPLAVCGRCTGIYFGFLLGTIAYPFARRVRRGEGPGRVFLLVTVAPMVLDVLLEAAGIHESSTELHALSGAWFGVLIPFLIVPGAVEGISQLLVQHNPQSLHTEKGLIDA
jgi:uncharacterized membrane protein